MRSLPIVVGAGLSVGMVAWLQTYRLLAVHGANDTAELSGCGRDCRAGPLLAGLLVAGRMGAGLAAELASMVRTRRSTPAWCWDRPIRDLVAPRAIACALAVPLLTVIIDARACWEAWCRVAGGKSTAALSGASHWCSSGSGRGSGHAQDSGVRPLDRPVRLLTGLTAGSRPKPWGGRHAGRRASEPRRLPPTSSWFR